jgi:hypothetical protein
METYRITVFLIILNYVIYVFSMLGILPIDYPFIDAYINPATFSGNIPENITYDAISFGSYIFGDFLRALVMILGLIVIAPFALAFLMNSLGIPTLISTLLLIILFIIYLKDLAEFIGNRIIK